MYGSATICSALCRNGTLYVFDTSRILGRKEEPYEEETICNQRTVRGNRKITPFHLYDEKGIRENAKAVKEAFVHGTRFGSIFGKGNAEPVHS